ncbi:MAG TPA: endonuclease domain-containing protein [Patescibacteria group bacterium]|nr:endonuclease domain-containing protein [Patescibacteria group bacterium]
MGEGGRLRPACAGRRPEEGEMKKQLTNLARQLRQNQTSQEAKLWHLLRRKNFRNLKFRRQYPIGNYIVDFCCPVKKLIIELDGGGHNEEYKIKADQIRDEYLKNQGFKILRIWNNGIDNNLEGVYEKIIEFTE